MRRNEFEDRPGGKRYRGQLDRIEEKLHALTLVSLLVAVLVVALIVFVTWRV